MVGFSGNGEGIATCPPCSIGQYSIFSDAVPITQCVSCSSTCPSGQGVISPCDYQGKPEDRKCGMCPIGTYNNGTLLSCQSCSNVCPRGEGAVVRCNTTGLTSDRVCGVCGAGRYQSGSSLLCSDCTMCAMGSFCFKFLVLSLIFFSVHHCVSSSKNQMHLFSLFSRFRRGYDCRLLYLYQSSLSILFKQHLQSWGCLPMSCVYSVFCKC